MRTFLSLAQRVQATVVFLRTDLSLLMETVPAAWPPVRDLLLCGAIEMGQQGSKLRCEMEV